MNRQRAIAIALRIVRNTITRIEAERDAVDRRLAYWYGQEQQLAKRRADLLAAPTAPEASDG